MLNTLYFDKLDHNIIATHYLCGIGTLALWQIHDLFACMDSIKRHVPTATITYLRCVFGIFYLSTVYITVKLQKYFQQCVSVQK